MVAIFKKFNLNQFVSSLVLGIDEVALKTLRCYNESNNGSVSHYN